MREKNVLLCFLDSVQDFVRFFGFLGSYLRPTHVTRPPSKSKIQRVFFIAGRRRGRASININYDALLSSNEENYFFFSLSLTTKSCKRIE